ncbi:hypothetical protein FHS57_003944 [Runella defluvii]|uniref:DUF5777 domain-containing protein n=1 Tax=Runella defluvii TaxID=370973 RepID=A0A7W5ZN65_9BACT|nr:DUF5777 family beta-barrel protein [Runella defluvii]MBB3839933.1 hypothetical protein [Runella defluvii]HAK78267.1 hypothetical protein [Runella sp.]HAO50172.1 hypothetical protein [Runella sp.]
MKVVAKIALLWLVIGMVKANAQDDLTKLLEQETPKTTDYTSATFKGTRIINGHSVETVKKNHLDFLIHHRFDRLNSGAYNLFGLDYSTVRLGFEYGLTDNIMIGVGRSSVQKTYDFFGKAKLLRQASGTKNIPVSITGLVSAVIETQDKTLSTQDKTSYCTQLLIARKFNDKLSLQLNPTLLYRNRVATAAQERALFALGFGGRMKVSKRVSLNAEYYWAFRDQDIINDLGDKYNNSLAIGFDIETGGHVFQLHFTNSSGMVEKQFIGDTAGSWGKGDIRYGFNVSRTFSFDKRAKSMMK